MQELSLIHILPDALEAESEGEFLFFRIKISGIRTTAPIRERTALKVKPPTYFIPTLLSLIHIYHACFDFDIRFPKMPSYLRRSAIQHALGTVSSYKTRLDLWEKTDGKSGKPRIVYENLSLIHI